MRLRKLSVFSSFSRLIVLFLLFPVKFAFFEMKSSRYTFSSFWTGIAYFVTLWVAPGPIRSHLVDPRLTCGSLTDHRINPDLFSDPNPKRTRKNRPLKTDLRNVPSAFPSRKNNLLTPPTLSNRFQNNQVSGQKTVVNFLGLREQKQLGS